MSKLVIKYQSESGEDKTYEADLQEKFSQLNTKQFKQLVRIFVTRGKKTERRLKLRAKISKKKASRFRDLDPLFYEKFIFLMEVVQIPEEVLELLFENKILLVNVFAELNFLEDFTKVLHQTSHLPSLAFGLVQGPQDALSGMPFKQLNIADQYLSAYQESKDDKLIKYLFAWLYTPFGWILPDTLQGIWAWILTLCYSKSTQTLAILNFVGLRNEFSRRFPLTFSQTTESKGTDYGYLGLVVSLAGEKFGLPQQVEKTDANMVFIGIEKNNELAIERS